MTMSTAPLIKTGSLKATSVMFFVIAAENKSRYAAAEPWKSSNNSARDE